MAQSPLLGLPPESENDKLIYRALQFQFPDLLKLNPTTTPRPHADRAPGMIIGTSFAIALVIIITSLRIWVRLFRSRAFGADDVVIIPAAIGACAYLSLNIATEAKGCLGKHVYDCTYSEFGWFYELAHSVFAIWNFVVFSIKISIVLQNRRMTGMASRKWQIAHWTYLVILMILLPICTLTSVFNCTPIQAYFTLQAYAKVPDPTTIKCLNQAKLGLATRSVHIITDWLLLPVPIIIIVRLQMSWSRKIRILFVFVIGVISSIASIIRNVQSQKVGWDSTWDYYDEYAWDVVDIFFATIVASLPALNGLLDDGLKRLRGSVSTATRSFSIASTVSSYVKPPPTTPWPGSKDAKIPLEETSGVGERPPKVSWSHDSFVKPVIDTPVDLELQVPSRNEWDKFKFEEAESHVDDP